MSYFIYILKSEATGSSYVGHTSNLEKEFSNITMVKVYQRKVKGPGSLFTRKHIRHDLKLSQGKGISNLLKADWSWEQKGYCSDSSLQPKRESGRIDRSTVRSRSAPPFVNHPRFTHRVYFCWMVEKDARRNQPKSSLRPFLLGETLQTSSHRCVQPNRGYLQSDQRRIRFACL